MRLAVGDHAHPMSLRERLSCRLRGALATLTQRDRRRAVAVLERRAQEWREFAVLLRLWRFTPSGLIPPARERLVRRSGTPIHDALSTRHTYEQEVLTLAFHHPRWSDWDEPVGSLDTPERQTA